MLNGINRVENIFIPITRRTVTNKLFEVKINFNFMIKLVSNKLKSNQFDVLINLTDLRAIHNMVSYTVQ